MLHLLFPGFAQTDEFLDLLGEARLPGLDMLLARARREAIPQTGLETLLCTELGIARQHDFPIAAITLAQSGAQPGSDCWLRADPVHVRIERDRVILSEIAEPSPDEARLLCEALSAHFGAEFSPQPLRPGAWVVRTATEPGISTTPLSLAAGRHIDPLLPTGKNAAQWRRLLNEAQMLLFSHPVNQTREAHGEPVINSVWLWGGGCLPGMKEKKNRVVFCGHADWRALAEYAGADVCALPDKWNLDMPEDALIAFDAPHRHLRLGDFNGWLQAMQEFEHNWLLPLLASGRAFRIDDPLQGTSLRWRSAYRWKFWRRPAKSRQQTLKIQPPPAESGVDAFGNRF